MIRKWVTLSVLGIVAAVWITGCDDWTSGGGVSSWNNAYDFVNFSGVYRAPDGNFIVKESAPATSTAGSTASRQESLGTGDGIVATFSKTLGRRPVFVGSIQVTDGVEALTDADGDGQLTGNLGGVGDINYNTGAITVNFFFAPNPGQSVIASYLYYKEGTSENPEPGSTQEIYSFTVLHQGSWIQFRDNSGNIYEGTVGGVNFTGGDILQRARDPNGVVSAQFELTGNANGGTVQIVGTLQGTLSEDDPGVLFDRQMAGTWIESSGRVGEVFGTAPSVAVQLPPPDFDDREDLLVGAGTNSNSGTP